MAEVTLTVRQIMNLGLWDKVCGYKGWSEWSYNEGRIEENELVTFDDTFEKVVTTKENTKFTIICPKCEGTEVWISTNIYDQHIIECKNRECKHKEYCE